MQLSCLSRNTLYISGPSSRLTVWVMTKDGSIWPSSMRRRRSSVQRLTCVWPGADGQALVHHLAHRDLVDQPAIDAGDRDHAGRAADIDHLAQHMRPVALGSQHLLGAVVDRIRHGGRHVGFHADGIDALLRALAAGELVQALDHALLVEVDGDGAAGFRHFQALGQAIDGDHLLGAEQDGAADRHLTDRTAAPDRHRVGRLDVALDRRLPAGREDVAEEENLLVRDPVRHLDVRRVGKGNAQIFGLPARIAAGQMRVAEQAGRRVAEHLVGEILLAVGASGRPRSCRACTARTRRR